MSQNIGFIGLGNMGGRMATCILRSGRAVLGFDPREGRAAELGLTPAVSVAEVGDRSDLILMSLPDSGVVEGVMLGDDGLLGRLRPGQVIVDLSTSAPSSTVRLAELVAEKGGSYIDAGISGGPAAAEKGALTLMVGGDRAAADAVQPVFDAIATNVYHMGASGSGHTAKVLNNFLNAINLSATAEVMVAAKKSGLDLGVFLDVLNTSSGVNFATLNRFPNIIRGDYMEGGLTTKLMLKDVGLYLEHTATVGVSSLNAPGPVASFGLANARGYGDVISNHVVDAIGDVSGGVRLYEEKEQ